MALFRLFTREVNRHLELDERLDLNAIAAKGYIEAQRMAGPLREVMPRPEEAATLIYLRWRHSCLGDLRALTDEELDRGKAGGLVSLWEGSEAEGSSGGGPAPRLDRSMPLERQAEYLALVAQDAIQGRLRHVVMRSASLARAARTGALGWVGPPREEALEGTWLVDAAL